MIKWGLLLLTLFVLCPLQSAAQSANAAEDNDTLRQLVTSGQYAAAVELLESIAADTPSFSVLYNLGVLSQAQQDVSAAMTYYLRARLINPRHEQLNQHISALLAPLNEATIQDTGWQLADAIEQSLNPAEHAATAFILWGLFCAALIVRLFAPGFRDTARITALFLAGLLLIVLGTFIFRQWYATERPLAVVTQSVSMMSGPANEYFTLGVIAAGVPVRIITQRDDYALIQSRSGRTGWLQRDTVEKVENNRAAS